MKGCFVLSVEKRYDYLSANLIYSYNSFYDQAPSYLCQFKRSRVVSVHSYGTRGSEMNSVIPEIKAQGTKTFMYNRARLWNSLSCSIKSTLTVLVTTIDALGHFETG